MKPTALIREMARKAPGGVIRWGEARDEYALGSAFARGQIIRGGTNFHMNIMRILRKYFLKVDGARGYYMLMSSVFNDDTEK